MTEKVTLESLEIRDEDRIVVEVGKTTWSRHRCECPDERQKRLAVGMPIWAEQG